MPRIPQFSIRALMVVIVAIAVELAIVARAVRTGGPEGGMLAILFLTMGDTLAFDAYQLGRRARTGRPPFGAGWSGRAFAGTLLLVAACLYGPFAWLLNTGDSLGHVAYWLILGPVLPGFVALIPLSWLTHQRTIFEFPLIMLTTTLLLMGLVRLVARGHPVWACALALLFAIPSSLFAHAAFWF